VDSLPNILNNQTLLQQNVGEDWKFLVADITHVGDLGHICIQVGPLEVLASKSLHDILNQMQ